MCVPRSYHACMLEPYEKTMLMLAIVGVMLAGCDSVPMDDGGTQDPPRTSPRVSAGYAGLYDVVSQNQGVAKLLVIKTVPDEVATEIRAIAETCQAFTDELKDFAERDVSLDLAERDMPRMEHEARTGIENQTRQRLLFTSGEPLARHLLIAQVKAMQYVHHMCKTLADEDDDAQRSKALTRRAADFAEHEKRLLAMLAVPSATE